MRLDNSALLDVYTFLEYKNIHVFTRTIYEKIGLFPLQTSSISILVKANLTNLTEFSLTLLEP